MKKIISITLILSVILSMFGTINAFAATEGKCGDNAYWKLEDGVLTIWGEGPVDYSAKNYPEWFENRNLIKRVIVEEGITTLYGKLFFRHNNLETVEMPNSLRGFGLGVFDECYNISHIDWKGIWVGHVLMYAPDGSVNIASKKEIEDKKIMGWSTEPPIKLSDEDVTQGLKKGIDYLEKNLYYEAQNEFQQFSDANWSNMTKEQQETIVDYINKSKAGAEINEKMPEGINYFNQGLYYEAIRELQGVCDAHWYNMTKDQQQTAVDYINNAKSKLADYQFTTGKNYYNKGLYYEAKPYFESAVDYYEQLNYGTQWQSANDYLYNTNQRIKEWENRNTYTPSKSSSSSSSVPKKTYRTYSGTNIPMYESVIGDSEFDLDYYRVGNIYVWKHIYLSHDRPENAIKYGKALEENGFTYRGLSTSDNDMGGFGTDYNYYDNNHFVTIHYTKTFITIRIQDR